MTDDVLSVEEAWRTPADRIIARLANDPRPRELYPSDEALRVASRAHPFADEQEVWTWAQGYDAARAPLEEALRPLLKAYDDGDLRITHWDSCPAHPDRVRNHGPCTCNDVDLEAAFEQARRALGEESRP